MSLTAISSTQLAAIAYRRSTEVKASSDLGDIIPANQLVPSRADTTHVDTSDRGRKTR